MGDEEKKICVYHHSHSPQDVCLVWDANDISELRGKYRIVGAMLGSMPDHPSQNNQLSLPLVLLPEEVTLCVENNWIELFEATSKEILPPDTTKNNHLMTWKHPQTENETHKYMVFKELHQRGYYITSGFIFGGDFAVYPADPLVFHADFVVSVRPWCEAISPLTLITFGRLGVGVKKTPVIASVDNSNKVLFFGLTWRGVT